MTTETVLPRTSSRYSLAALLLLIGCSALMLAATRSAVQRWSSMELGLLSSAIAATLGAIVGGFFGVCSRRWFTGGLLGLLGGGIVGGMAGAQMAAPPDFVVVSAGISIVLVFSFFLRPAVVPRTEFSGLKDSVPQNDMSGKHPLDRD